MGTPVTHHVSATTGHAKQQTTHQGASGHWRQEVVVVVDADEGPPHAEAPGAAPASRPAFPVPAARAAPLPPPQIAHLPAPPSHAELRAAIPTGAELQARQLAVQFMRTGRLPHHGQPLDRETATLQYLALRTVKVALRESNDNKHPRRDMLAHLLPLGTGKQGRRLPTSARKLARRLRVAHAEDPGELDDLLEPIFEGDTLPRGLLDLIADSDESDDGDALVEMLAEFCDLPGIPKNRRRLLELADEAEHDLLDQNRHRIFSSLNTEPAAARTAGPKSFQDAYCELVHDERGFCGTFKKIVELFGTENLRSTLKTLKKALGGDMDSLAMPSSHSPEYLAALHAVVSSLSNLSQIEVVLDTSSTFLQMMARRGTPVDEQILVKGLPELFVPGMPSALRFQSLCDALDLAPGEQRTILLNELAAIIRALPTGAFSQVGTDTEAPRSGEDRRVQLIDAAVLAQEEEHEHDPEYYTLSHQEQKLLARPAGAPAAPVH